MFTNNNHTCIHTISIAILSLAALLWMGMIFNLSAQPATQSGKFSIGISKELLVSGEKLGVLTEGTSTNKPLINRLDDTIRSGAHFAAFFILGLLVFAFLKKISKLSKYKYILTVLISAVYALLDEFHQYFVPGRAAQLSDFMLDCLGAICGMAIISLLFKVIDRKSYKIEFKK